MRLLIWTASAYACIFASLLNGEEKPLTIGTTSGYAPYVSLNAQGDYEGFDIDLARLLAAKLGRPLEIKDLGSMPSLMMGLKQAKVDALIWAISITDERREKLNLIHYQGEPTTTLPLLFWKTIPSGIKRAEDLLDFSAQRICVESGSYQEQVLEAIGFKNLKPASSIIDALLDLKYGKSIAVSVDTSLVPRLISQHPELRVLYSPLPSNMQERGNGIAVKKENQILAEAIEKAISELKQEGKIQELEKKWGLQ